MAQPRSFLSTFLFVTAFICGTAVFSFSQNASSGGLPEAPGKTEYERFAMDREGHALRGKELLANEQKTGCLKCHTVDGKGGRAGPDLFAIGDKYPRGQLIRAILEPSSALTAGYSTTVVETQSGDQHQGILKEVSDEMVGLMEADGRLVRIASRDIAQRRTSKISLMPEGLHAGLSLQEFADLVEYLVSLKQPETADRLGQSTPDIIPRLKKPIALRPFHHPEMKFNHPVWFAALPGHKNTFVVLEHQEGKIWLVEKDCAADRKPLFADISSEVSKGPFEGLMSIAFHPDFQTNRRYFLKLEVKENEQLATTVVERKAAADGKQDAGAPSRRLLKINQPADNHNGGTIAFGPDGYLYIAMGDGGPQEDPPGHSQNRQEFLGSMLRIDVDRTEDGKPYGVPPSNPFLRNPDVKPEIWAKGFREPWRFSFDADTGDLWLGDVGQNRFEEVSIVRKGENHGWNVYEAFEPFSNRYRNEAAIYTPPVLSLKRKHGVSVTGGFVYRGSKSSSFYGVYIFGDFESRRIWGITQENRRLRKIRQIGTSPEKIASFGLDHEGEIYLVGYEGTIFKLDFEQAAFE